MLKPTEEACLTALAFVPIAQQAGLPDIALNLVTGLGEEAGAALAAHPGVHHRPAPLAGSPTRQSVAPANGLEASSA